MTSVRFADRNDAGRRLARALERFREDRPVVVGIPRGGVPVAAKVAQALAAPLDVAVVRKVGAPFNPEFAIGAVAEGGVRVIAGDVIASLGLPAGEVDAVLAEAEAELASRLHRLRQGRDAPSLAGRVVLLVDDGLATGRTAMAAVRSLRARGAARVVLAVPVASAQALELLADEADEVEALEVPDDMMAIGFWYDDFSATEDEEVARLLAAFAADAPQTVSRMVQLEIAPTTRLAADLTVPAGAQGVVAFAHGSGSSRRSPRNRAVARALNDAGLATLLLDLLTPDEEIDRANVFDVDLLAARLERASDWLASDARTASLPLAYFGASTGAAAALVAAAHLGRRVAAVVSRGGRPDLAGDELPAVTAPTLLIVGGADPQVLELNQQAQRRLACMSRLEIVPGATHLFEEPGALEVVASLAIEWFLGHLPRSQPQAGAARAWR